MFRRFARCSPAVTHNYASPLNGTPFIKQRLTVGYSATHPIDEGALRVTACCGVDIMQPVDITPGAVPTVDNDTPAGAAHRSRRHHTFSSEKRRAEHISAEWPTHYRPAQPVAWAIEFYAVTDDLDVIRSCKLLRKPKIGEIHATNG
jgi:hypothetical protein